MRRAKNRAVNSPLGIGFATTGRRADQDPSSDTSGDRSAGDERSARYGHLPVHLFGGLLAERDVRCAAVGADPVTFFDVVDLLDHLEPRVVAAPVTGTASSLSAGATRTTLRVASTGVLGVVAPRFDRLLLLRRGAEDELGEHRHLLGERGDPAFELDYP